MKRRATSTKITFAFNRATSYEEKKSPPIVKCHIIEKKRGFKFQMRREFRINLIIKNNFSFNAARRESLSYRTRIRRRNTIVSLFISPTIRRSYGKKRVETNIREFGRERSKFWLIFRIFY